jgi:hypothetical protein
MTSNKKTVCQGVNGPCDNEGKKRRQNTAYNDDERNWVVMCDECKKHNDEHWDDMWRELNQGLYDSMRS